MRSVLLPHVSAIEIADGNVNFSFRICGAGGRAIFLKQATGFLKWQPQMALEAERMRREVRYYRDAAAVLGPKEATAYQPRLLHFDEFRMVLVLEFLEGHDLMIERCFESAAGVPGAAAAGW